MDQTLNCSIYPYFLIFFSILLGNYLSAQPPKSMIRDSLQIEIVEYIAIIEKKYVQNGSANCQ